MEADDLYIEPAGNDEEDYDYSQPASRQDELSNSDHGWQHVGPVSTDAPTPHSIQFNESTMATTTSATDFESLNVEPYIHLNGFLPNLTRNEGDLLRLKCNVAGTLPIDFKWYKNDAPLLKEKDRVIVKTRGYGSRLVIRPLEPLDQAFYRCEATNEAGKATTTALIQVKPNRSRHAGSASIMASRKTDDRSDETDDGPVLKPFTCQEYPFEACRRFLDGQLIYIHSKNIEDMRDIDRRLRAAFIVINNSSQVSSECKEYAARAACYHSYSICDTSSRFSSALNSRNPVSRAASAKEMPPVQKICKHDCERMEKDVCPEEYKTARSQNLIGKERDKILPDCRDLSDNVDRCLSLMADGPETSGVPCYVGNGESYRGVASTTKSGRRCKKWSDASKKPPFISTTKFPELKHHNYCRNPAGTKASPWCFTGDGVEEYCDVPACAPGSYRHFDSGGESGGGGGANGGRGLMGVPAEYAQYVLLAAGVLGVLFVFVLIAMACYCVRRSRRNRCAKIKKANGPGAVPLIANGTSTNLLPQGITNGRLHHHINQRDYYSAGGLVGNGIRKHEQPMEMSSLLPTTPPICIPSIAQQSSSTAADTILEIPATSIRYMEELGEGQFGKVWKAEWSRFGMHETEDGVDGDNEPLQVAVKALKDDASARVRQEFEHEVAIMARLKHPNVVELLGVSCMRAGSSAASSNGATDVHPSRPCMVFEFMMHGNLNEFLLLRSPYSRVENVDKERILLDHSDFLHIATQIASGMEYLASQHYVHRDLATRNCLVADRLTIKISDFGLMRDVYASDYYRQQSNTFLPIRWMPPEAIMYGRYSEAADVWAYGVTLWEIYSYGTQPYYGYSNPEVADMVRQRCLLPCPDNCPLRMYSLMVECWHETPSRRPRFSEIYGRLQTWSVVSSPAHSSAANAVLCSNGRIAAACRVAASSVHSDRSVGNSSGASSCRIRNNGGLIGSSGQIMAPNSNSIPLGVVPPAGTPTSRNSPYSTTNKILSSPQLSRTPLNVNGYALRGGSKPFGGAVGTELDAS